MLDVHCHMLPAVDDGAPDWPSALEMARGLVDVGFTAVAPSPHFGEGPGGDVSRAQAETVRQELVQRLHEGKIPLEVLPNAEHHVSPTLFTRIDKADVTPLGGAGQWLLVELPWRAIPNVEAVLFRLQAKGYRLLLAHPERYNYLELDVAARLCERGIKMQLELGSFFDVYGDRAEKRARTMMERGLAHVVATDLHRPEHGRGWLPRAVRAFVRSYGEMALAHAADHNPRAMVRGADPAAIRACTEALA